MKKFIIPFLIFIILFLPGCGEVKEQSCCSRSFVVSDEHQGVCAMQAGQGTGFRPYYTWYCDEDMGFCNVTPYKPADEGGYDLLSFDPNDLGAIEKYFGPGCTWNENSEEWSCRTPELAGQLQTDKDGNYIYETIPICTERQAELCGDAGCSALVCDMSFNYNPDVFGIYSTKGEGMKTTPETSIAPSLSQFSWNEYYGKKEGKILSNCTFMKMDETFFYGFSHSNTSPFVNTFMFGVGRDIEDYYKFRYLFPASDVLCSQKSYLSQVKFFAPSIDRYTNYFDTRDYICGCDAIGEEGTSEYRDEGYLPPNNPTRLKENRNVYLQKKSHFIPVFSELLLPPALLWSVDKDLFNQMTKCYNEGLNFDTNPWWDFDNTPTSCYLQSTDSSGEARNQKIVAKILETIQGTEEAKSLAWEYRIDLAGIEVPLYGDDDPNHRVKSPGRAPFECESSDECYSGTCSKDPKNGYVRSVCWKLDDGEKVPVSCECYSATVPTFGANDYSLSGIVCLPASLQDIKENRFKKEDRTPFELYSVIFDAFSRFGNGVTGKDSHSIGDLRKGWDDDDTCDDEVNSWIVNPIPGWNAFSDYSTIEKSPVDFYPSLSTDELGDIPKDSIYFFGFVPNKDEGTYFVEPLWFTRSFEKDENSPYVGYALMDEKEFQNSPFYTACGLKDSDYEIIDVAVSKEKDIPSEKKVLDLLSSFWIGNEDEGMIAANGFKFYYECGAWDYGETETAQYFLGEGLKFVGDRLLCDLTSGENLDETKIHTLVSLDDDFHSKENCGDNFQFCYSDGEAFFGPQMSLEDACDDKECKGNSVYEEGVPWKYLMYAMEISRFIPSKTRFTLLATQPFKIFTYNPHPDIDDGDADYRMIFFEPKDDANKISIANFLISIPRTSPECAQESKTVIFPSEWFHIFGVHFDLVNNDNPDGPGADGESYVMGPDLLKNIYLHFYAPKKIILIKAHKKDNNWLVGNCLLQGNQFNTEIGEEGGEESPFPDFQPMPQVSSFGWCEPCTFLRLIPDEKEEDKIYPAQPMFLDPVLEISSRDAEEILKGDETTITKLRNELKNLEVSPSGLRFVYVDYFYYPNRRDSQKYSGGSQEIINKVNLWVLAVLFGAEDPPFKGHPSPSITQTDISTLSKPLGCFDEEGNVLDRCDPELLGDPSLVFLYRYMPNREWGDYAEDDKKTCETPVDKDEALLKMSEFSRDVLTRFGKSTIIYKFAIYPDGSCWTLNWEGEGKNRKLTGSVREFLANIFIKQRTLTKSGLLGFIYSNTYPKDGCDTPECNPLSSLYILQKDIKIGKHLSWCGSAALHPECSDTDTGTKFYRGFTSVFSALQQAANNLAGFRPQNIYSKKPVNTVECIKLSKMSKAEKLKNEFLFGENWVEERGKKCVNGEECKILEGQSLEPGDHWVCPSSDVFAAPCVPCNKGAELDGDKGLFEKLNIYSTCYIEHPDGTTEIKKFRMKDLSDDYADVVANLFVLNEKGSEIYNRLKELEGKSEEEIFAYLFSYLRGVNEYMSESQRQAIANRTAEILGEESESLKPFNKYFCCLEGESFNYTYEKHGADVNRAAPIVFNRFLTIDHDCGYPDFDNIGKCGVEIKLKQDRVFCLLSSSEGNPVQCFSDDDCPGFFEKCCNGFCLKPNEIDCCDSSFCGDSACPYPFKCRHRIAGSSDLECGCILTNDKPCTSDEDCEMPYPKCDEEFGVCVFDPDASCNFANECPCNDPEDDCYEPTDSDWPYFTCDIYEHKCVPLECREEGTFSEECMKGENLQNGRTTCFKGQCVDWWQFFNQVCMYKGECPGYLYCSEDFLCKLKDDDVDTNVACSGTSDCLYSLFPNFPDYPYNPSTHSNYGCEEGISTPGTTPIQPPGTGTELPPGQQQGGGFVPGGSPGIGPGGYVPGGGLPGGGVPGGGLFGPGSGPGFGEEKPLPQIQLERNVFSQGLETSTPKTCHIEPEDDKDACKCTSCDEVGEETGSGENVKMCVEYGNCCEDSDLSYFIKGLIPLRMICSSDSDCPPNYKCVVNRKGLGELFKSSSDLSMAPWAGGILYPTCTPYGFGCQTHEDCRYSEKHLCIPVNPLDSGDEGYGFCGDFEDLWDMVALKGCTNDEDCYPIYTGMKCISFDEARETYGISGVGWLLSLRGNTPNVELKDLNPFGICYRPYLRYTSKDITEPSEGLSLGFSFIPAAKEDVDPEDWINDAFNQLSFDNFHWENFVDSCLEFDLSSTEDSFDFKVLGIDENTQIEERFSMKPFHWPELVVRVKEECEKSYPLWTSYFKMAVKHSYLTFGVNDAKKLFLGRDPSTIDFIYSSSILGSLFFYAPSQYGGIAEGEIYFHEQKYEELLKNMVPLPIHPVSLDDPLVADSQYFHPDTCTDLLYGGKKDNKFIIYNKSEPNFFNSPFDYVCDMGNGGYIDILNELAENCSYDGFANWVSFWSGDNILPFECKPSWKEGISPECTLITNDESRKCAIVHPKLYISRGELSSRFKVLVELGDSIILWPGVDEVERRDDALTLCYRDIDCLSNGICYRGVCVDEIPLSPDEENCRDDTDCPEGYSCDSGCPPSYSFPNCNPRLTQKCRQWKYTGVYSPEGPRCIPKEEADLNENSDGDIIYTCDYMFGNGWKCYVEEGDELGDYCYKETNPLMSITCAYDFQCSPDSICIKPEGSDTGECKKFTDISCSSGSDCDGALGTSSGTFVCENGKCKPWRYICNLGPGVMHAISHDCPYDNQYVCEINEDEDITHLCVPLE